MLVWTVTIYCFAQLTSQTVKILFASSMDVLHLLMHVGDGSVSLFLSSNDGGAAQFKLMFSFSMNLWLLSTMRGIITINAAKHNCTRP